MIIYLSVYIYFLALQTHNKPPLIQSYISIPYMHKTLASIIKSSIAELHKYPNKKFLHFRSPTLSSIAGSIFSSTNPHFPYPNIIFQSLTLSNIPEYLIPYPNPYLLISKALPILSHLPALLNYKNYLIIIQIPQQTFLYYLS